MATKIARIDAVAVPSSTTKATTNDQCQNSATDSSQRATIHSISDKQLRRKDSKKLSLSFPILLPTGAVSPHKSTGSISTISQSPIRASPCLEGSTPVSTQPLPSPDNKSDDNPFNESPDFLTLIASQERKVMELKEELSKAETELTALKKQWTTFEAKKKQAEIRTKTVKMGRVSPKTSVDLDAAERARRREAREARLKEMNGGNPEVGRSNSGKRSGQRVFTGSHTRTLSLLQNIPESQNLGASLDTGLPKASTENNASVRLPKEDHRQSTSNSRLVDPLVRPSTSRQPTLQELLAGSTLTSPVNLGKTYKDLAAASRNSLPPGTDEVFKQGKQVYQGLNQGFWNFVEDIRQATVGDEAIQPESQPEKAVKKKKSQRKIIREGPICDKHGHSEPTSAKVDDVHKKDKDKFWNEFGLATPKSDKTILARPEEQGVEARHVKDHTSHSSTDSRHPPSLLADLMDVNEDDEAWDNWPIESPASIRKDVRTRSSLDSDTTPACSITGETLVKDDNHSHSRIEDSATHWAELTR